MWARVCIDVNDRQDVVGYSVEVHGESTLDAVHVFPCGPFDSPAEVLVDALEYLTEQYGTQLELSLF